MLLIGVTESFWDREFQSLTNALTSQSQLQQPQHQKPMTQAQSSPRENDELARTAGMLVDSVREEVNPKFKNSQFLGLMRQLRDGEVVVDGNKMVDAGEANSGVDVDVMGKGKGKSRAVHFMDGAEEGGDFGSQQFRPIIQQSPLQGQHQNQVEQEQESEDPNDVYFRQENRDFAEYWTNYHSATAHVAGPSAEARAWADMQREWDRFEATSTGIRPVDAVEGYRLRKGIPTWSRMLLMLGSTMYAPFLLILHYCRRSKIKIKYRKSFPWKQLSNAHQTRPPKSSLRLSN